MLETKKTVKRFGVREGSPMGWIPARRICGKGGFKSRVKREGLMDGDSYDDGKDEQS